MRSTTKLIDRLQRRRRAHTLDTGYRRKRLLDPVLEREGVGGRTGQQRPGPRRGRPGGPGPLRGGPSSRGDASRALAGELRPERDQVELEPFRAFEGIFRPSFPVVDFAEHDKEYIVSAELPGMDEKDLEVKLSSGVLTIRGEKKEERKEEQPSYRVSERRYGSFERSFRLPEGVEEEKIDAKFVKGLLTIRLPKSKEALQKEKRIPIKTSS